MAKFYNLHYIADLADYAKGQGIPHHKNFGTIELGTIISYNEAPEPEDEKGAGVPFGVKVLSLPVADNTQMFTMKADGASLPNYCPSFLDAGTRMITKKVDLETLSLVPNGNTMPAVPDHLKFQNPNMSPHGR